MSKRILTMVRRSCSVGIGRFIDFLDKHPLASSFFTAILITIVIPLILIFIFCPLTIGISISDIVVNRNISSINITVTQYCSSNRIINNTIEAPIVLNIKDITNDYVLAHARCRKYLEKPFSLFIADLGREKITVDINVYAYMYANRTTKYVIHITAKYSYDILLYKAEKHIVLNGQWNPVVLKGTRIEYRLLVVKGDTNSYDLAKNAYQFLKRIGAKASIETISVGDIGEKEGILIMYSEGGKEIIGNTTIIKGRNPWQVLLLLPKNINITVEDLRKNTPPAIVYFAYGTSNKFYYPETDLFRVNIHTLPYIFQAWVEQHVGENNG